MEEKSAVNKNPAEPQVTQNALQQAGLRWLNGSACFVAAYLLVFLSSRFGMSLMAAYGCGIPVRMFPCYLEYLKPKAWSDTSVVLTFIMGPLMAAFWFFVAKASGPGGYTIPENRREAAEFWQWVKLLSLNFIFGELFAGAAVGHGTGFILKTFGADTIGRTVTAVLSLFGLTLFAAIAALGFIKASFSRRSLLSDHVKAYLFASVPLVWFTAGLFLFLLQFGRTPAQFWSGQNVVLQFTPAAIVLIIMLRFEAVSKEILGLTPLHFKGSGNIAGYKAKPYYTVLTIALLASALFFFAFRHGLRIG